MEGIEAPPAQIGLALLVIRGSPMGATCLTILLELECLCQHIVMTRTTSSFLILEDLCFDTFLLRCLCGQVLD